MNKFGLISLSVLGTLGISAGAVAILNNAPSTKNKLNISFGDKVLVGQEANKDTVVKDETDNKDETNNLVAVTYMLDGVPTTVLQEKGAIQSDIISIKNNNVNFVGQQKCFLGWTKTPGELDIVYKTDKDITLYPLFIPVETGDSFNIIGCVQKEDLVSFDFVCVDTTLPFYLNDCSFVLFNGQGERLTFNAIGVVDDTDVEAGLVKDLNVNNVYSIQYYCPELDKTVIASPADEIQEIILDFIYGDNAEIKDEALFTVKYTSQGKEESKADSLSTLSMCISMNSTNSFNGETYYIKGYSTSVDSTKLVSFGDMDPETTYYAVYAKADDFYSSAVRLYSIQELETNVEG